MTIAPTPVDSAERAKHALRSVLVGILALVLIGVGVAVIYAVASNTSSSDNTVHGSGMQVTRSRTVPAFRSVDLAGSNNVVIRVGEPQSVRIHGDDNLIERVTTDVSATMLVIGNTPGSYSTTSPMGVEVTMPSLSDVTLSGSGLVTVSGIEAPRLAVTISGSGIVLASGTTERLDARVTGSGQAELGGVEARVVYAVVSGSGEIVVTAIESLDASVPGNGSIVYAGEPISVTKSVTGSGDIVP